MEAQSSSDQNQDITEFQSLWPYHTTAAEGTANKYLAYVSNSTKQLPSPEYLKATFSIMIQYGASVRPYMISVGEDYDTLMSSLRNLFDLRDRFVVQVRFKVLEKRWGIPNLTETNIKPMLRLLKSRNGVDMLQVVQSGGMVTDGNTSKRAAFAEALKGSLVRLRGKWGGV